MQEVQFEIISALRAYLMIKLKFHNIRRMNSGTIVTIIIAYFTQIDLVTKTEQVMLITYLPIPFYLAVISYLLNFLIFLDVLYCSYLIIFACWGDWLNPFIIILGNFIWIVSIFKPRISSQHKPSLVCFLGSKSLTLPDKILHFVAIALDFRWNYIRQEVSTNSVILICIHNERLTQC